MPTLYERWLAWRGYRKIFTCSERGTEFYRRYDSIDGQAGRPIHEGMSVAYPDSSYRIEPIDYRIDLPYPD